MFHSLCVHCLKFSYSWSSCWQGYSAISEENDGRNLLTTSEVRSARRIHSTAWHNMWNPSCDVSVQKLTLGYVVWKSENDFKKIVADCSMWTSVKNCLRLHIIFLLCLVWGGTSQEVAVPSDEGCHQFQTEQEASRNFTPCTHLVGAHKCQIVEGAPRRLHPYCSIYTEALWKRCAMLDADCANVQNFENQRTVLNL
jgi:hypothetical protein